MSAGVTITAGGAETGNQRGSDKPMVGKSTEWETNARGRLSAQPQILWSVGGPLVGPGDGFWGVTRGTSSVKVLKSSESGDFMESPTANGQVFLVRSFHEKLWKMPTTHDKSCNYPSKWENTFAERSVAVAANCANCCCIGKKCMRCQRLAFCALRSIVVGIRGLNRSQCKWLDV